MIDIVKVLRERSGLVAPDDADALATEVRDWAAEAAPSTVFSRRAVTYAIFPGLPEETRTLGVVAFASAAELARFATRWT